MIKKNDQNLVNNVVNGNKVNDKASGVNEMSETLSYYQRNRDKILNRAREYYKKNKETINEKRKKKYKELNDAEKETIKNDRMNRYNNMDDAAKIKLKEYRRNYYKNVKKNALKNKNLLKICKNNMKIIMVNNGFWFKT